MNKYKVGYFAGSFSNTSINRLLAKALARLSSSELELSEIRDKPILNLCFKSHVVLQASQIRLEFP